LEYNEEGKEKLTLMAPGGIKSVKVTDLRNVFDYHDVSVEEFMLWSDSKDGRKKQRDLLLSIFPKEVQDNFITAMDKEKGYYDSRSTINKEVDLFTKQLAGYEMTPEQLADLEKKPLVVQRMDKLNAYKKNSVNQYADLKVVAKDIQKSEENIQKMKDEFPDYKAGLKKTIDEKNADLNELRDRLQKLELLIGNMIDQYRQAEEKHNQDLDAKNKELQIFYEKQKHLNDSLIPEAKLEESEQKINTKLDYIKNLESTNTLRLKVVENLEKKKEEQVKVEKDLTDIRSYKDSLLTSVQMPIDGLSIDEEGLSYNGLPFDKNQLSTSQFMQVVLRILVAINKKTPIIPIGRAESFGKKKLKELIELAEKENCQIFFEKVKDEGELTIEVFEEDIFKVVEQKLVPDDALGNNKKKKETKELPENWREQVKQKAEEAEKEDQVPAMFDDDDDDELDLGTTMFDEV